MLHSRELTPHIDCTPSWKWSWESVVVEDCTWGDWTQEDCAWGDCPLYIAPHSIASYVIAHQGIASGTITAGCKRCSSPRRGVCVRCTPCRVGTPDTKFQLPGHACVVAYYLGRVEGGVPPHQGTPYRGVLSRQGTLGLPGTVYLPYIIP